jgi:hypothetical protein
MSSCRLVSWGGAVLIFTAVTSGGCAGDNRPSGPTVSVDALAKERVDAMRRLADAAAKDPNGAEVRGIVEEMSQQPLDPAVHPAEAAEIVRIYNERVKGKLSGEIAEQVRSNVTYLERGLKSPGK